MESKDQVAKASTVIDAPRNEVWVALTDPGKISEYMFGTEVDSDWRVGSPITWAGEWEGRAYEDKGTILEIEPNHVLAYSHFSPLSGLEDTPENYHSVRIELAEEGAATKVTLTQDNNESAEAREHSEANWRSMLDGLREVVEDGSVSSA